MTKVLLIAYYFPPLGGAGVQRAEKFVRYLPPEGFQPAVVAGPLAAADRWTPYDETLLENLPSEIAVRRVEGPVPAAEPKWRRRLRGLAGLSSPFAKWWISSAAKAGLEVCAGASLVFATMPPFESAWAADALSQRLGVPWVADFRDPWALDEIQVYPTALHRLRELKQMEALLHRAALVIMNTPEAALAVKRVLSRIDSGKIVTIPNGFDPEDIAGSVTPRTDGKFRIVHAGYLLTDAGLQMRAQRLQRLLGGAVRGVDILTRSPVFLIEAITRWVNKRPQVREDLEIVFAGKVSQQDRDVVEASAIGVMARFPGYMPHAASLQLVRTADLLFLPMHNVPDGLRSTTVPSKTYEYMAAERPILAAVPEGDAKDFLRQCGTALIVSPDDVEAMTRILEEVYAAWNSGRAQVCSDRAFLSRFERRTQARELAAAFHRVLENG